MGQERSCCRRIPLRSWGLRILFAGSLILFSCSPGTGTVDQEKSGTPPSRDAARPVRPEAESGQPPQNLATAVIESRSRMIQVGGRLKPKTSIVHTCPADGLIRELSVRPGDSVSAGTVLFSVDRNEAGQSFRLISVRSRIGGTVSKVDLLPEEEVREGDPGVTVIGNNGYILEAKISDKDAFKVSPGQAVQAHTTDGDVISGRLKLRSPEPDYATGLFELTFEFPASASSFAGAFVLVDLPAETLSGFFVPAGAIDRRYGRNFLWLVDPDSNTLVRREVELGDSLGEDTLVKKGLEEGEKYLIRLSGREREGAPIPGGRS